VAAAGSLARLGHRVALVEMRERILPDHDADAADVVAAALAREGVRLFTAHRAVKAVADTGGVAVELLDVAAREPVAETADHVLLCLGHRPRSRDLGLDTVTVETDRRGHVLVDAHLQTATAGLYAVGGLVPTLPGPVVAALEGRTAAAHAAGKPGPPLRYRDLPRQVGGPFPLALVGPGEDQARAEGYAVGVGTAVRPPAGWAKVLTDRETGRLLGVGLAGPGAGALITAAQVALLAGLDLETFARTGFPRPGLGAVLAEAVQACRDAGEV
jgi:dihydrolipoamide dehydrogenase